MGMRELRAFEGRGKEIPKRGRGTRRMRKVCHTNELNEGWSRYDMVCGEKEARGVSPGSTGKD